MGLWSEFKKFALKGSVIDLAVGIIIGAAFGTVVKSMVDDVIMPPIGLALGEVDFSDRYIVLKEGNTSMPANTPEQAKAAGYVTLNYGLFLNNVLSFFIVAFAVFLLIRGVNRARDRMEARKQKAAPGEPKDKPCPYCFQTIPLKATRCPHCTSPLPA